MGALFLYRGNLHRVADIPRRFPMPPRAISLNQFRRLLRKRNLTITQFLSRNPNAKPNPRVGNENHDGTDKTECPKEASSDLIPSSEPTGSALDNCKGVAAITENQLALEGVDSMDDGDGKKEVRYYLDGLVVEGE